MGQIANYLAGQILISRKNFDQLFASLRKMLFDQKDHFGSTTRERVMDKLIDQKLDAAFEALGLTLHHDIYGNIINITVEAEDRDRSYEHLVLPAIAEVVLDGSYLQIGNEDGTATKYGFNNGICTIETSEYLFPSTNLYVVVKHIYSDYYMGPDVQICGVYPDMQQAKKRFKGACSELRQFIRDNASHFTSDIEMIETDTTFILIESEGRTAEHLNAHPIADVVIHKANGMLAEEGTNG